MLSQQYNFVIYIGFINSLLNKYSYINIKYNDILIIGFTRISYLCF